ncbi:DNA topoisomerase 2-alpha [Patella vulgata]|uniref:DNA topoisomerase 2-alpha n=1 Tax=Patella vulgata TaxID=6465 RepID=UPI0021801C2C|nr:DNA topoisomerase 2-alpha [Patella vulgata]
MEEEMPLGAGDGPPISNNANKRLSVERIYQKKSQLEHILLRPDTYIGSVERVTQPMWVFDEEKAMMIQREVTFVPGLFKIFDEILVNAADNKQRDANMNTIKINIDAENNQISVWNNGKGIPVVEHKTEKMYVPTMIFGHLLTSSNYNDFEKKVTGGRNGYGAKLCNIFSTKFTVETSSGEYKKCFRQTWQKNMGFTKEPTIKDAKSDDFTCVSFSPDLSKFKMECLDKDIVDVFSRRAYDIAGSTKGVKVILNGKRIPVKNFKEYINLFIKDKEDENGQPLKIVYSDVNPRWEVALTLSDKGFQQASFVNSIATTKGGRHIDHVSDQIVKKLIEIVQKKDKGGIKIKPFQIKNHLWVFVNCLIENPTFDSQTKENMTLQPKSFGSKCSLTDDFMKQASKCGIVESILSWMKFKAQTQLNKKSGSKNSKLKGIPKLDDANNAGTKSSQSCTLILTEGDSAKSLAVAGLGVIGRDKYGVFPLRGKLLNVREASHKQIMDNAEINNIIKIMGLQFKNKYNEPEDLKTLRYGKLMIMTDQDHDGSHIKGLLVNFIHHFWPNLLKYNVVEQFITPIVKAFKGKNEHAFYSMPEFEEWQKETPNFHTWKIKYYKGLGTSTAKEAKEYFTDIERHRIRFKYGGAEDDASITLAFSKKKIEDRKTWLTNFMEDRKRRNELGLPELYLYGKETQRVTFNEFINKELILFSEVDNIRSIPSMVDGFKPGQRKVIFTCFKRNITKEIKVAQLAGSVGEHSAYHHGEASLMGTIVNLAQNFVGSNNMNLLMPQGQFGTRLHGGKDAASPRYIFTYLNPLTRLVFSPLDDALLKHLYDDNQKIEPEWYIPIIPMVLVNGADGIGTGWSTKIQNFDIREIVANLKRMLDGDEPLKMLPSFKNFKGTIDELSESRYVISGEISILDDNTIEISELPVRVWTQNYKEDVLEPMLHGTDKTEAMITDYKEYHTESTVRFVVKMTTQKLAQAEAQGIHKVFKIQNSCTTNSMVLFDHNGCIRRYDKAEDILKDFYELRFKYYIMRKNYMEGMLEAESNKLDNIARFILEKIEGTIVIENKRKKDIIQMLVRHGYDSDPVKAWKAAQNKGQVEEEESQESQSEEDMDGPDYNYLLSLQLWSLSKEKKDELLKQKEAKAKELSILKTKTPSVLWKEDLEIFLTQLNEKEQQERDDEEAIKKKGASKGGKLKSRTLQLETMPSPHGIRVVPRVDSAIKLKAEKADNKKGSKKVWINANKINYSFGESEDGISSDSDNDDEFKPTENNENHSEPVVLPR